MHIEPILPIFLWAASGLAQNAVDDFSFGHKQSVSSNSFSIPGWAMLGEGHVPQILSDKVILTPPVGGNKRGALWAEKKNTLAEWTIDAEFRAGGADRSGGNMQLWYAKDGASAVSTSSVYTAGKFEGLALVIDTVSGIQKIRGFLNDGNTDYKNHPMVESLAFGHCDYVYRNLGRPSKIQIKHSNAGLEVLVDGKECFATSKVKLPTDYNFGITAASSDPPDSFEVFKFQVSGTVGQASSLGSQKQFNSVPEPNSHSSPHLTTSQAQFEDLFARLHTLEKSISNLFGEIHKHTQSEEARYQEILRQLGSQASAGNIDTRLSNMDRILNEFSRDFRASDHKGQFEKINAQLQKTHEGLTEHIPGRLREYVQNHTPRIGFIAFSFMAFQSCCLAVLLFQKYRKSTMPKKFL